jgi:hypothetical protein
LADRSAANLLSCTSACLSSATIIAKSWSATSTCEAFAIVVLGSYSVIPIAAIAAHAIIHFIVQSSRPWEMVARSNGAYR